MNLKKLVAIAAMLLPLSIANNCITEEQTKITDEFDGLKISVQANKESYLLGEEIKVTTSLTNLSQHDIVIKCNAHFWCRELTLDCYGSHRLSVGFMSKTYMEGCGIWMRGGIRGGLKINIPAGKSIQRESIHIARESGCPVISIEFYSTYLTKDDFPPDITYSPDRDGNWFGEIAATKTIEVKNEMHPDVVKALNEAEELLISAKDFTECEKVMRKFYEIGFASKDTLLRLLRNPSVKENCYGLIITRLCVLGNDAFSEPLYRELISIACNPEEDEHARLAAMPIWKYFISNFCYHLTFPDDFKEWAIKQLTTLKDDKNKAISDKANELLKQYNDSLEKK